MSMGLVAVLFLFICGCLAGLVSLIMTREYFLAGVLAVLMIASFMLFASFIPEHSPQIDALKSEISALKAQIDTLQDMANNPAYLAGICLIGASALVGIVFFGIYGLIIIQAKIRKAERQDQADRAGYLPRGAVRQAVSCPERPEPVSTLPEYRHDDSYAIMPYVN